MTRYEIVEKLNRRMKGIDKNCLICFSPDEKIIDFYYRNELQAWIEINNHFHIVSYDKLSSYIKHSEALVQFYVQGQRLLEELN